MSDVLARIRVRETHGIRRFLYPLTVTYHLSETIDIENLSLKTSAGQAVPLLVSLESQREDTPHRLDFALSLEPLSVTELLLSIGGNSPLVSDPLQFGIQENANFLRSIQEHLVVDIGWEANISNVVYDGISMLSGPSSITHNGETLSRHNFQSNIECDDVDWEAPDLIAAWVKSSGEYKDGIYAETTVDITACKSWAKVSYCKLWTSRSDEIVFTLPLAITSPTLTCDFGVGGYVFGKLDSKATDIVWRTEFGDAPYAKWTVATAGRVDYVGEVDTAEAFLPQRWFHLIDSDKALAVAITKVPQDCKEMTVRLTHEGDVSVAFRLGETTSGPAEFGVCYHFLNDVPAIAAATNPQSILLPPIVEVLPV
jgi:hypothetical protein